MRGKLGQNRDYVNVFYCLLLFDAPRLHEGGNSD
jgi:hypothetical protein